MIKISELKEGDVLIKGCSTSTILHNLGKVVITENENGFSSFYSEKELNRYGFKLIPPTPEKKYFMGFEVRKYPERPIVEVGHDRQLRRLIEVKEDCAYCKSDNIDSPFLWKHIYRIPETKIVEPISSGTREGDGC